MAFDIHNPYFRNKVLTATPEQLRLMLFDGAIHFLELGVEGLDEKNYEKVFENLSQGKAIVLELMSSLKPEHDPDLCAKLTALYTFMYSEITQASFSKDVARLEKVIELIRYERETWVLLMERVAQERGESGSSVSAGLPEVSERVSRPGGAAGAGTGSAGGYRPLSVQG